MDQFLDFTGRFHPLLVHLPIGILLIAVVFVWVNQLGRVIVSSEVIRLTLAIGALTAIVSMLTGLSLASTGDFNEETIATHKYAGITLAVSSVGLLLVSGGLLKWGSLIVTVLIIVTGHLGGTITHGEGYLFDADEDAAALDIASLNLDNAIFYKDAVQPVLAARCYSCHGESKQKGKLRLDSPELITKGGKDGKVIVPGNPEESELIQRIDLPLDDEDHMPPKEKKQLTDQEKKLISLWIASGGDFSKKISELVDEKELSDLIASEQNAVQLPDVDVSEPDEELIATLTEQGVAITPVAVGSNLLQVNFVSVPDEVPALLLALKPIASNVVSLKILRAEAVNGINDFENLVSLNLSGSKINATTIDEITKCTLLTTLNLSGTNVTTDQVNKLKACKNLKSLNLYNTSVKSADLPGVQIEFGDYEVPTLATDTTEVKAK